MNKTCQLQLNDFFSWNSVNWIFRAEKIYDFRIWSFRFILYSDRTKNKHLRVSPFKFTKGKIETMELFEGWTILRVSCKASIISKRFSHILDVRVLIFIIRIPHSSDQIIVRYVNCVQICVCGVSWANFKQIDLQAFSQNWRRTMGTSKRLFTFTPILWRRGYEFDIQSKYIHQTM